MLVKVYGAAGCGKTTFLEKELERLLGDGVGFEHILFTGSVNATIDEMKERMTGKGASKKDLAFFNTMHGICYRLLNYERPVCGIKEKRDFCKGIGIEYEPNAIGYEAELIEGNRFFSVYSLAISNLTPKDEMPARLESEMINSNILRAYEKFKEENNLWDFEDMLRLANERGAVPWKDYQFYDEFQDMSPLQNAIYKRWSAGALEGDKVVFIAGDPQQSIYSFHGGNPEFFIEEKGQEVFLQKSYRMKRATWEHAVGRLMADESVKRKLMTVEVGDGGEVGTCDFNAAAGMARGIPEGEKAFFLTRTNTQASELRKALRSCGLWTWGSFEAYSLVECLGRLFYAPMRFSDADLKMLERYLPGSLILKKGELPADRVSLPKLSVLDFSLSFTSVCTGNWRVVQEVKDYLEWHRQDLRSIPRNFHIYIGTVHSKKGGEAEYVFANLQNPRQDADLEEEGRVAYVAVTRAKNAFFELV